MVLSWLIFILPWKQIQPCLLGSVDRAAFLLCDSPHQTPAIDRADPNSLALPRPGSASGSALARWAQKVACPRPQPTSAAANPTHAALSKTQYPATSIFGRAPKS